MRSKSKNLSILIMYFLMSWSTITRYAKILINNTCIHVDGNSFPFNASTQRDMEQIEKLLIVE